MDKKCGPFPLDEHTLAIDDQADLIFPLRSYDCANYQVCLDLVITLNWESFACKGCCGEVSQELLQIGRANQKSDKFLDDFCDLPDAANDH